MAAETPLGRNGTAEDVAKAILFLASNEAAAFITGEYIAVNGGILMRP
jgi:3-oxoacyl-[acyl-carrier protein] reductase